MRLRSQCAIWFACLKPGINNHLVSRIAAELKNFGCARLSKRLCAGPGLCYLDTRRQVRDHHSVPHSGGCRKGRPARSRATACFVCHANEQALKAVLFDSAGQFVGSAVWHTDNGQKKRRGPAAPEGKNKTWWMLAVRADIASAAHARVATDLSVTDAHWSLSIMPRGYAQPSSVTSRSGTRAAARG
jgi:hypothetical protein